MTFFYHNHKPDNHVKQSIKYANFRKRALKFKKKILNQPPLHENYSHILKNLFSMLRLQNLQKTSQNERKIIKN